MDFYELTLYFTDVRCADETGHTTWGSDEINYLGVGVLEDGTIFKIPYKDFKSWDAGDELKNYTGRMDPRMHIVTVSVAPNSLHAAVALFLTENDSTQPLENKMDVIVAFLKKGMDDLFAKGILREEGMYINAFNFVLYNSLYQEVKRLGGSDDTVLGFANIIYKHPQYVDRHTPIVPAGDDPAEVANAFYGDNSEYQVKTRWHLDPVPIDIELPILTAIILDAPAHEKRKQQK